MAVGLPGGRRRLGPVWVAAAIALVAGCGNPSGTATGAAAGAKALAAAHSAVEAWGRFTASGDPSRAAPWFHKGGPQYRRFEEDAERVKADPSAPNRLTLTSARVAHGAKGDEQRVVRGTVVASRTGMADQTFRCELVLFRAPDDRWRVWVMRDMTRRAGPVPASPRIRAAS